MKNKIKIAFIGCGNMAQAIIGSLTNISAVEAVRANGDVFEIVAADRDEAKLMAVKSVCAVTLDNAAAVSRAEYVFLAVKPQSAAEALAGLDLSDKTVISIMAGVNTARLAALTGAKRIVRVMPNLCARVGESFNAYVPVGLDERRLSEVVEILGCFGVTQEVKESELDAVTGISGSGPAFVFMTIQALFDEGVAQGFSPETAKAMAIQTVIGSALTAEKSDAPFDALINSVCSKGGTTIEGVEHLRAGDYTGLLRTAVQKAIRRSKELSE